MTIQHDENGFLVGETVKEIKRSGKNTSLLLKEVRDIKRLLGLSNTGQPQPTPPSNDTARRESERTHRTREQTETTRPPRLRDSRGRFIRDLRTERTVESERETRRERTENNGNSETETQRRTRRNRRTREQNEIEIERDTAPEVTIVNPDITVDSDSIPAPIPPRPDVEVNRQQRQRDSRGRWIRDGQSESTREQQGGRKRNSRGQFEGSGDNDTSGLGGMIDGLDDRITTAPNIDSLDEVDPTIKAFKEVSEPLAKGYQFLFGGKDNKKDKPYFDWFKKIWKTLKKTESNTEENNGGDSGGGFLSSVLSIVMGGGLFTAIGSILALIFSPIALGIGAAGIAAWGLFTKSGNKFFTGISDGVISAWQTSVNWVGMNVFTPMGKAWDATVLKVDTMFTAMGKAWDDVVAGAKALLDKFVINPVKRTYQAGKDIRQIAIDNTSQNIEGGVNKATSAKHKVIIGATNAIEGTVNAAGDAKDWAVNKTHKASNFVKGRFNTMQAALAYQGGNLTGLSEAQTRALVADTQSTESGGNISSDNRQGYFGQYQFGAEALIDAGLVKEDGYKSARKASGKNWYKKRGKDGVMGGHEAFLRNPENWTTSGGLSEYLKNKEMQDKAYSVYSNKHIKGGMRSGALSKNSSPEKIAAYVKASHLKGVGGANKLFLHGTDSRDGNGTGAGKYAKDGARAIQVLAPKVEAELSKITTATGSQITAAAPKPQSLVVKTQSVNQIPPTTPTTPKAPKIAAATPNILPIASDSKAAPAPFMVTEIGQNLPDRMLAHIQMGGIGGI